MVSSNGTAATCIMPMAVTSNGVWQGDNPIHFSLPLLIVQITLVIVVTRALGLLVKPFHQPRVIAEIIVSSSLHLALSKGTRNRERCKVPVVSESAFQS
ncbi:unnamed protein product [Sphagnum troendelagicum]|jgi:hypothetical protein|uniref:Uncharacterized protein n=1 Tax=Sphagnum jensenii TaxID=128206 RepID=A0ABP0WGC7_9BRYO